MHSNDELCIQDGPMAGAAGHDINYIALTGALHSIGPKVRDVLRISIEMAAFSTENSATDAAISIEIRSIC